MERLRRREKLARTMQRMRSRQLILNSETMKLIPLEAQEREALVVEKLVKSKGKNS